MFWFGPIFFKSYCKSKMRVKSDVSLLVCFATKAIRCELLTNLSANYFIVALKGSSPKEESRYLFGSLQNLYSP